MRKFGRKGLGMDMLAGRILVPGTAHGPFHVLDGPFGPRAMLCTDGRMHFGDGRPDLDLTRAVVAVRSVADGCPPLIKQASTSSQRPVGWIVESRAALDHLTAEVPPSVPVFALDANLMAKLIPCPRASLQPTGQIWLT